MSKISIQWTHAETIHYLLQILDKSIYQTLACDREDLEVAHQFLTGKEKMFDDDLKEIQLGVLQATREMMAMLETELGIKKPGT